jgi:phosphoenolpyruvate synthase/pyruvate phosphate dikinase
MKGKELIKGYSGNKGTVICKLRVIQDDPEATDPTPAHLKATKKGECIVAVKTVPAQEPYLELAAAIIQNSGGKLSHGNIFATTRGKPSIYNTQGVVQKDGSTTQLATDVLKDGQLVIFEGFTESVEEPQSDGTVKRRNYGAIYEYIPESTPTPVQTAGGKPSLADLMAKYGVTKRES